MVRGVARPARSERARLDVEIHSEGGEGAILSAPAPDGRAIGGDTYISIRPEDVILHRTPPADRPNVLEGRVETVGYLGNMVEYLVTAAGLTWRVQAHPGERFAPGEGITLELPPAACRCLPADAADVPALTIEADRAVAGAGDT